MANDANSARKTDADNRQEGLEKRAKQEVALRIERGDFEEVDKLVPSISIEGHYVNVHYGEHSFQFDANKDVGGDLEQEENDESELEKATKSAKTSSSKKGK